MGEASGLEITPESLKHHLRLEQIPDEKSFYNVVAKNFGLLGRESYLNFFDLLFRQSSAAQRLEAALHDAQIRNESPEWFEIAQTGVPRLTTNGANDTLSALKEIANDFDQAVTAHRSGALSLNTRNWTKPSRKFWDLVSTIGFERGEIAKFLDRECLGHTLSFPVNASLLEVPAEGSSDQCVLSNAGHGGAGITILHEQSRYPPNTLGAYIEKQIQKAKVELGPTCTHALIFNAVWNALIQVASHESSDDRPNDVMRYVKGETLTYIDGKEFTKNALRKRVANLGMV